MKRIISFLTSLILILLCAAVPATAAGTVSTEIVADKEVALSGDTVTFTIVLLGSAEIKSGAVDLSYDANVFEIESTDWVPEGTFIETFDRSTSKGAFAYTSAHTLEGALFCITFRVLENAPFTTAFIQASVQLKDNTNTSYVVVSRSTHVAINCAHETLQEVVHDDYKVMDATCESAAVYYKSCVLCKARSAQTFFSGSALGHEMVSHPAQDATCEVGGWNAYDVCSRCGESNYVEIPAHGHDYVHHAAQAPTCTAIGWESYDECSYCGDSNYVEIPALGHDPISHTAQAPTCTAPGWEAYEECSRCGNSNYVEIPALGHDLIHYTAQAPTCTAPGWNAYDVCSRCGESNYVEIPAHGHNYVSHAAQAPTCTAIGWESYDECTHCGDSNYVEIPALGHSFENVVDPQYLKSEATCESPAVYYKSCACGHKSEDTFTSGTTTAHEESDWIVDREPTTLIVGSKHKECLQCGETLRTETIDRLPIDQGGNDDNNGDDEGDDNGNVGGDNEPGEEPGEDDDNQDVGGENTEKPTQPDGDKDEEEDDEEENEANDTPEGDLQVPTSGCGNVKVTISEAAVLPVAFIAAAAFRLGKKKKDE